MRISHEHKFIFFSVPRTGSTTVREILDEYSDVKSIHISKTSEENPFYHHISPLEVERIFDQRGWEWDRYKKFCFVRNPFDRVVSLFYLKRRIDKNKKSRAYIKKIKRWISLNLREQKIFEMFVKNNVRKGGRLYEPVTEFIAPEGCKYDVDVLRYEKMPNAIIKYLNKNLDISVENKKIPHKNKSKRKKYEYYYDEELIKIVSKKYKKDLEFWDYEF